MVKGFSNGEDFFISKANPKPYSSSHNGAHTDRKNLMVILLETFFCKTSTAARARALKFNNTRPGSLRALVWIIDSRISLEAVAARANPRV